MQFWVTSGEESFKNITESYKRGGNAVIIVYDITDRESFENLNSWLIEVEKNASKNVIKVLAGNNCELEDVRKVTYQEGKDFAELNGMKFIETSPKNGKGVHDLFECLVRDMIIEYKEDKKKKVIATSRQLNIPHKSNYNCLII